MQRDAEGFRPPGRDNPTILWPVLTACVLFAIPLVSMPFSEAMNWGVLDFLVWGLMLLAATGAFTWTRTGLPPGRRWIAAASVGAVFVYVWAELAVGVFTRLGS